MDDADRGIPFPTRPRRDSALHRSQTAAFERRSPAVTEKWCRRLFNSLDQDNNGYIDKREFVAIFPQEEDLFRSLDTDGNERIDRHEFTRFFSEGREGALWSAADFKGRCEAFLLKKQEESLLSGLRKAFPGTGDPDLLEHRGRVDQGFEHTYKSYRIEEGNAVHIAAAMCKEEEAGPIEVLLSMLQKKDQRDQTDQQDPTDAAIAALVSEPFRYTGKGRKKCGAQAIHLLAVMGQAGALQRLVGARADVNARAKFGDKEHATPLHDAAWLQHSSAVMTLLDLRAEVDLADSKGMTALHLVAQLGNDEQAVREMIRGFVESGADLKKEVAQSDWYTKPFWGRTAFTIAADRRLSKDFPMKALHLLAPNFAAVMSQRPPENMLFDDISAAADYGPKPGEALALALLQETYKETALAQALAQAPAVRCTLARLTVKLPELGAAILDALTDTPEVQDTKDHALPTLANLSGNTMRCAYKADVSETSHRPQWKKKDPAAPDAANEAPTWHKEFDSTKDFHTDNYPVKVQVIHLPDILDREMALALSRTPSWCLEIFAKKSVQAVVIAGWDQVKYTYGRDLLFNILILPLLLIIGTRDRFEAWKDLVWWLLLTSTVRDVASPCLALYALLRTKGELEQGDNEITWLRWLVNSVHWVVGAMAVDAMACFVLVVFVFINTFEQDSKTNEYDINWRIWLSVTFLLRCVKVMYLLRCWFTSFNTFFSAFFAVEVRNILTFVVLNFFMFWGAFVVLTEEPSEMLEYCTKALLFTEWDGVEKLKTAHGKDSVLSLVLAFVCSTLFTFCFNSLVTAVFSDKYNDDGRRSDLIFLSERARLTLKYMCGTAGVQALPGPLSMRSSLGIGLVCSMIPSSRMLLWAGGAWVRTPEAVAAALVIGVITTLVVLRSGGPLTAAERGGRFVWLCYREDFDPDVFQYGSLSDDSCQIAKIKQSLDAQATRSEEAEQKMKELQKDTDSLKKRQEQLGDDVAAVHDDVGEILGILRSTKVPSGKPRSHTG